MPAASAVFTAYASLSALLMLARSIFHDFLPVPVRVYFTNLFHVLFKPRSNNIALVIEEQPKRSGLGLNQIYAASELYLSNKITIPSTGRLKISKSLNDKTLTTCLEKDEIFIDHFNGLPIQWLFSSKDSPNASDDKSTDQVNYFELSFDKHHKDNVMNNYIPYILTKSQLLHDESRTLKLGTLGPFPGHRYWETVNFVHPSTFNTLAMDPDLKSAIKADLDLFVSRREFYNRVGRAWKRGYLLYGPPGTGKSSLIAAIANYLKFDVFDLQLANSLKDSDLRRLLLLTSNRSILVIEDIDCTVDIQNRNNYKDCSDYSDDDQVDSPKTIKPPHNVQVTLSGLLNFIDGLWSSCGDERIIIFTTNHKEMLDPALLRPGRMDMHIHMSYLTVGGFSQLASNYLQIDGCSHPLFGKVERLIGTVNVTPAQVAEELMRSQNADEAFEGVIKLLMKEGEQVIAKEPSKGEVDTGQGQGQGQGQNGHSEGNPN